MSQSWDETRENLLYNASSYRKYLMLKDTESLMRIESFLKKSRELEPDQETLDNMISNLHFSISCYNHKYKKVKKLGTEYYPESEFMRQFSEEDYNTMKDNYELLDLITLGLYTDQYPYSLSSKTNLYKEIKFYDIKRTDTIAEIGAGKGDFSKVLFLTGFNNLIYFNEISISLYYYIEKNITELKKVFNSVNLIPIKGKKKKTKLPTKVNKIIIRSTYHHFTDKEEMLTSIYESLYDDGDLFIREAPLKDSIEYCPLQIKEEDILKTIINKKFILQEQLDLDDYVIFRFKKDSYKPVEEAIDN